MKTSYVFILLSAVGVIEASIHAWYENAFTTEWFGVNFAPYASFFGVPYWVFGVIWFPLVFVVCLWYTRFGRSPLGPKLLILLTLGNIFTVYLWFVDLLVIHAINPPYIGLYATNYGLTGLVAAQNWSTPAMRDFALGTILGMIIGVFFGAFGVAFLGVLGGIFGAIGGYTSTR